MRDENQGTLLMHFARQGEAEPLQWLLAHGADRDARNESGKTAAVIGRTHAGDRAIATEMSMTGLARGPSLFRLQCLQLFLLAGDHPGQLSARFGLSAYFVSDFLSARRWVVEQGLMAGASDVRLHPVPVRLGDRIDRPAERYARMK